MVQLETWGQCQPDKVDSQVLEYDQHRPRQGVLKGSLISCEAQLGWQQHVGQSDVTGQRLRVPLPVEARRAACLPQCEGNLEGRMAVNMPGVSVLEMAEPAQTSKLARVGRREWGV